MKWSVSKDFATRPRVDDESGVPVASVFVKCQPDWQKHLDLIVSAPAVARQQRQLKTAWDELNRAESDLARMRSYKRMSYSMKADFNRASFIATESRRTIDSILGGVR